MNITKNHRLDRIVPLALVFVLLAALLAVPASQPSLSSLTGQSYLVQGKNMDQVSELVERFGGRVTSRLEIIGGVGAVLSSQAAAGLRSLPEITAVTPNSPVEMTGKEKGKGKEKAAGRAPATDYPDVIGADVAWGQGAVGSGISVAVVDTGLEPMAGLTQTIEGYKKGRVVAWVDFVEGSSKPKDPNGHGTHIAGIIANTELGQDSEWNGTAPGVNLIGVRVLNEQGIGTYEQVIQGLQWVLDHQDEYNIHVMNLSLVSPVSSSYWADPLN